MIRLKLFLIALFLSVASAPALANPLKPAAEELGNRPDTAQPIMASEIPSPPPVESMPSEPIYTGAEEGTDDLLREQIRLLEDRQQQLEQEIDLLRQQVEAQIEQSEQNAQTDSPDSANIETAEVETPETEAENPYPMGLDVEVSVGTFDPKTSGLQDFAVIDQGDDNVQLIRGDLVRVDYEPTTAIRYGATLRFEGTPIDVGFSSRSATSHGNASAVQPPDGLIFGTLLNPNQGETILSATAESDISHSVTDIEAGYRFDLGQSADSRIYGGIRFADISQSTSVLYGGEDTRSTSVNIERDFSGVGLHVGNRTDLQLGGGFSLFGQAGGSLLVGDVRFNQQEFDNETLEEVSSLNQSGASRVIPVIDLAAGVSWKSYVSENALLDLSFGYAIEEWFNVLDTVRYIDNVATGAVTQESSNLSSDGVFFELGLEVDF